MNADVAGSFPNSGITLSHQILQMSEMSQNSPRRGRKSHTIKISYLARCVDNQPLVTRCNQPTRSGKREYVLL